MHRNGRTIVLSKQDPNRYTLPVRNTGTRPTIVCPDCERFRTIQHTLIFPHRADDGVTRCPGSGTRVVFDVAPIEWEQAMYFATITTDRRRSKRVMVKAEPAPVKPLHRTALDR